jgi:hypothetical protein
MGIGFVILMVGYISIWKYPILQYKAIRSLHDLWRIFAFLPLPLMIYIIFISIDDYNKGSNLWPVLLLFSAPIAWLYLAILLATHKILQVKQEPDGN